MKGWIIVLGVVAAALVMALLFRGEIVEEGPRPRPEEGVPRAAPLTPPPPDLPLNEYRFRLVGAPGIGDRGPLVLEFDQRPYDHVATARLTVGSVFPVKLHPARTRVSLSRRPDGLAISPNRLDLPDEPWEEPVDLLLSSSGGLALTVLDGRSEAPIPDYLLRIEGEREPGVEERARTDEEGVAHLHDLPAGLYRIRLVRFDHTASPDGQGISHPDLPILIRPGEVAREKIYLYPKEERSIEVRVEITVDGLPPPPDLRLSVDVDWRLGSWKFRKVGPGDYVAREESSFEIRRRDEGGDLRISGVGVRDFHRPFPPGSADGDSLRLRADLSGVYGRARGILRMESGEPIPGRTFRIVLSLPGHSGRQHRKVTTDDYGEFDLPFVDFPLGYYAMNETPGERLVPSEVKLDFVREGQVVEIVRYPRNEVGLTAEDPELFRELFDASHGRILLEVTPVTTLSSRVRESWGNSGFLDWKALDSMQKTGRTSLRDLPRGTYSLWMLVSAGGAWNGEVRVAGGTTEQDFPVSIEPSREAIAARLLRDGTPLPGALVIDGYVPHYLCYELPRRARVLGTWVDEIEERCLDYTGADGGFRIPVHNRDNPWLTVVPGDGTVYHVEKADLAGRDEWSLRDHPADRLVTGRLVREDGSGLPGLRVALSPLGGADDRVLMQTPHPYHILPPETGEDGSFVIRGVRPGKYLFSVCSTQRAGASETNVFFHDLARIVDVENLPPEGLRVVIGGEQREYLDRVRRAAGAETEHEHR